MGAPRTRRSTLTTASLAILMGAPLSAQDVDLEALIAWPFPTELVAADDAPRALWVRNVAGARNVWVADGPDWEGRRLTDFDGDDGQEVTGLQVSADGSVLVFVRGGAPNRAGEIPNPTSEPEPAEREIWAGDPDAGRAWLLGRGAGPALSPDGGWVAYVEGGRILRRSTAEGGEEDEPDVLVDGRGSPQGLTVSPDGSRLAWSSRRGDHAFIGVYAFDTGDLTYLDPGLDLDGSPVWSPDGTRLAFLRIPNQRNRLPFIAVRETVPWSLRVADVTTGRAWTAFAAPEGPGSLFQGVSADNPVLWAAGDRLVFPWEGNGFTNLYSVPAGGGEPTPLAPGSFEVQYVDLAPDGQTVVFSSNQGDTNRQHLWEAPVDGSGPRQITPGEGVEWSPRTAGDGTLVFLASGGAVPAHAEVMVGNERSWLVRDTAVPRGLRAPEAVTFPATDGMTVHGQLFLPPGAPPQGGWPAVLFLHGGSRRQMLLGFHHRGYYHNAFSLNQYMASQGYAVLAVNYRSGIGYGLEFREAEEYGAGGASEVRDVIGAGLYLRSRPDVDPNRIGLWGGSYGGYLTAHGLSRAPELFKAGVDVHGVHDWNVAINNFVPSYDPAARPEFARLAFESSPMSAVDRWRAPVLLIHGDDDRNVRFSESVELAEELRKRDVHVEHLVFPDEVHGFLLHRNWMGAYRATVGFFDRFLKGVTPIP